MLLQQPFHRSTKLPPAPTINTYIHQIRFRTEYHQNAFIATLDQLYGQMGATGQTGAFYKQAFESLKSSFDAAILEVIEYFRKARGKIPVDDDNLLSTTASILNQSAIAFKSILDTKRFRTVAKIDRLPDLIEQSFRELDELLILRMQDLALEIAPAIADVTKIPAANRYVQATDNQRTEALAALKKLESAINGSNDSSDEDRVIALSEIAAFEATIVQPRISSELIDRFINSVIAWMQRVFSKALIEAAAQKLLEALLKILARSL